MGSSSFCHRRQAGLLVLLATAAAILSLLTATPAVAESIPIRLVDRLADANQPPVTIDGTTRRVLPTLRRKQAIRLEPLPPHPILRFSVGLTAGTAAAIRFQAIVRSANGSWRRVYDRKVDRPGWYDEQLELDGLDPTGSLLVLKRNVAGDTPRRELSRGVWGEPMLLPTVPMKRKSVVLVSIDTLRADRVGAYESSAEHTPALDGFAKTGILYENAYSPSTWTLPSHFSMLRGVPASRAPQTAKDVHDERAVPTTPAASAFRSAGYLTAGFTGGGFVSATFGFSEGFDSYYSYPHSRGKKHGCSADRFDGAEVLRRTKKWLQQNGNRPFFLFVHTYDAHDRCPLQRPGFGRAKWDFSQRGRKRMSEYYDEVISKADGVLGGVLAAIASLPAQQRIIVAVTSDHGEALWEHGTFGHGCPARPYDPLVRVPLVVRPAPRHDGGRRIATPVSVGSIAPTLLALAGLPLPAEMELPPLPGLGLAAGQKEESIYAGCGDWLAVRSGRYKLIAHRGHLRYGKAYDLERDPGETENVADEHASTAAELRNLARAYWARLPSEEGGKTPGTKRILDETTRERLRALGYLE